MDSFDMKTPTPAKGFACLIAKATFDESKLWYRRLGHINFKNLNKLVKGNLVRGLPSKVFKNDHTCVACHKGKQHRASCKAKLERLITVPLHTLHMDLFGPTSVKSINHASYCLPLKLVPKRLKDDEAKDDEPTKKSGKRRKQMARRGLHTIIDKDDSEGSDEVSEQDDSVT
ncbi:putative ribonuclease H-like domain-containing protein, partial [Tanacetum coccineum]